MNEKKSWKRRADLGLGFGYEATVDQTQLTNNQLIKYHDLYKYEQSYTVSMAAAAAPATVEATNGQDSLINSMRMAG